MVNWIAFIICLSLAGYSVSRGWWVCALIQVLCACINLPFIL